MRNGRHIRLFIMRVIESGTIHYAIAYIEFHQFNPSAGQRTSGNAWSLENFEDKHWSEQMNAMNSESVEGI